MSVPAAVSLVLFDGGCNFCNRSVQFVLNHEADHNIRFASSSSAAGQDALRDCGLRCRPGSIVVIEEGRCYTKSSATIRLARHLKAPWNLFSLIVMLPAPIRDLVYELIAANRQRISGRMPHCRVGKPSEMARFLA
jgi:predicted DCC family thiol-disulfide oxidoreductase YuxK